MNIREQIGKMPIWKALVIIFLAFTFMAIIFEEIVLSKITHLFDKSITQFDKTFKEESNEVKNDYQSFDERQEYDKAESDINSMILTERHVDLSNQDYVCFYKKLNRELTKLYTLAYTKHHPSTHQYITDYINRNNKFMEEMAAKGAFDAKKCPSNIQ